MSYTIVVLVLTRLVTVISAGWLQYTILTIQLLRQARSSEGLIIGEPYLYGSSKLEFRLEHRVLKGVDLARLESSLVSLPSTRRCDTGMSAPWPWTFT